jgi:hypothetical protein
MNGAVSTTAWALHRLRGFCPDLLTYALIYTLGYTATAWIIGRQILGTRTGWVAAFLLGWRILRVLAPIPIVGGLIWFVAGGFASAPCVTIWRACSMGRAAPAPA